MDRGPGVLGVVVALALGAAAHGSGVPRSMVVLISADAEWKVVRARYSALPAGRTPFGEYLSPGGALGSAILFHGGWGKISAAGSTQYAIDRWKPELLINLGTCGGFEGATAKDDTLLVDKTVVYDIVEQMGDPQEAIRAYSTTIDLAWVGTELPKGVKRSLLVSGDRDIVVSEIPELKKTYGAVAADWESGAIAYVARANAIPVLILRGVSDVVGAAGDETYGNEAAFEAGAAKVMTGLLDQLPVWIGKWRARR